MFLGHQNWTPKASQNGPKVDPNLSRNWTHNEPGPKWLKSMQLKLHFQNVLLWGVVAPGHPQLDKKIFVKSIWTCSQFCTYEKGPCGAFREPPYTKIVPRKKYSPPAKPPAIFLVLSSWIVNIAHTEKKLRPRGRAHVTIDKTHFFGQKNRQKSYKKYTKKHTGHHLVWFEFKNSLISTKCLKIYEHAD